MVEASAQKAPTSARAQAQHAVILFNAQRHDEALQTIDRAIENIPGDNPLLLVNRLIMLCNMGILDDGSLQPSAQVLSDAYYDIRSMNLYATLVSVVASGRCPNASMTSLRQMFDAMGTVPTNSRPTSVQFSHIRYFSGVASANLDEPEAAIASFEQSLHADPSALNAMTMARIMATKGYYDEALHLSNLAMSSLQVGREADRRQQPVSAGDIHAFQDIVRADIEASRGTAE